MVLFFYFFSCFSRLSDSLRNFHLFNASCFSLEYLLSLKETFNFNSPRAWPETLLFRTSPFFSLQHLLLWLRFVFVVPACFLVTLYNKQEKQTKTPLNTLFMQWKHARNAPECGKGQHSPSDPCCTNVKRFRSCYHYFMCPLLRRLLVLFCSSLSLDCSPLFYTILPVLAAVSLFIFEIAISYITAKVTFPTAQSASACCNNSTISKNNKNVIEQFMYSPFKRVRCPANCIRENQAEQHDGFQSALPE